ncbi:hypothetical protein MMC16_004604 [Acarospora aff. strigata]|nr:hypothetical protein [Acarospora aff. strigata]
MTFTEAHAEAPADDNDEKADGVPEEGGDEKSDEGNEEETEDGGDDKGGEDEKEADDDDEEEEEEEEEEPEDVKPKLEEECAKSAQCAPLKHHYDECVERVTEQNDNPDHKGPKESCVEECEFALFFSHQPSLKPRTVELPQLQGSIALWRILVNPYQQRKRIQGS